MNVLTQADKKNKLFKAGGLKFNEHKTRNRIYA
jgi:hypothetical protein